MRSIMIAVLGVLFLATARSFAESPDEKGTQLHATHRFDPIEREIEGWKVHIDPSLLSDSIDEQYDGRRAVTMLTNHLQRIAILIEPEPLAKLRTIEIWIERSHPSLHAMQYHPSRGWLIGNGYDERLTRKVHIPDASQLLSKEQMLKHPAVILHELAHGFHDQFLSFDSPEIIQVYENAKQSDRYTDVLLYNGRRVRHYGLTNHKEYFAEGTEAFFYRNDFYPFVRAELKQYDPELHDLMTRIWKESE